METTKLWNRNFSLVILASAIGTIGGVAGGFALAFLVFDETGSTLASALILAIQLFPFLFIPIVIAPIMDRLSRRDSGLSVVHYDWRNVHLTGRFCSDFGKAKSASQDL